MIIESWTTNSTDMVTVVLLYKCFITDIPTTMIVKRYIKKSIYVQYLHGYYMKIYATMLTARKE